LALRNTAFLKPLPGDVLVRTSETVPFVVVTVVGGALLSVALFSSRQVVAQSLLSPSFTTAQADSGKAVYMQSCESCHGPNLDDGPFAPPLKGLDFRQVWFGQSAGPLFDYISEKMPPAGPGSLGDEKYLQLLAYLLQQNDLIAGSTPLPSD